MTRTTDSADNEAASTRTFGEIFDRASFVVAELGHRAGAIGAAATAMHRAR